MALSVYLSGEIHTGWRDEIIHGVEAEALDIEFTSAVTDHDASDAAWATSTDQVVDILQYVTRQ